jgi:signal transduction histidine kinase
MLGDEQDNLWLSTNHGLVKFDTRRGKFQSYDVNDGLQSNEFNTGAYFQNQSGEMFFGGVNGFTVFHPAQIQNNPYRPPVVLTAFKKFDKAAELDSAIAAIKCLELSYKENFFAFEFAALDYTAPEKNRYAYRLEGFDRNWVEAGARRYASYTNLDPDAYVFRVKGSNNDGLWNETGAAVKIIITPPIWKTWWFRILAASSIIGLLGLIYRYRVNRLLEMERLRVRIASDLHDDIGATLTKISLHSELIQESADPDEVRGSLRKIGAMSRELVTTMSDIVWSIDARNDTLGNLVDRMRDFATGVLSVQTTAIDFHCAGLDMQKKLPVNFRQNIYLIFKEAINNIAKHAEASHVDVEIKNINGHFNMAIRDDGKGWRENDYTKLSGHGLRNMKMRAARIGGDLNISRNGGCTVSLTASALR